MMINRMRIKKNELFYYFFLGLLMFLYMMESTTISDFDDSFFHDVVQIIILASVMICFVLRKYSFRNIVKIVLLNLVGVICFISSGNTGLFMTMLAVTSLPDTNIDKTLKFIFKEELILFILVVFLSQIGIIPNNVMKIAKGNYSVMGIGLGFSHPNMLAAQASSILLLYLCTRKTLKNYHLCIAVVFAGFIFVISQSRTALILMFFAVLLLGLRKKSIIQKIIYNILPYMYMLIIMIVGVCLFLFGKFGASNGLVHFINDSLFNGRIGLAYIGLLTYPTTLFGKNIDMSIWNKWQYFALDNGQVMIWLQYGIVGFIAYFIVIQTMLKHIGDKRNFTLTIVAVVLLFWSVYEGTMYFLGKNFIYLFGAVSIANGDFGKNRKDKKYDT